VQPLGGAPGGHHVLGLQAHHLPIRKHSGCAAVDRGVHVVGEGLGSLQHVRAAELGDGPVPLGWIARRGPDELSLIARQERRPSPDVLRGVALEHLGGYPQQPSSCLQRVVARHGLDRDPSALHATILSSAVDDRYPIDVRERHYAVGPICAGPPVVVLPERLVVGHRKQHRERHVKLPGGPGERPLQPVGIGPGSHRTRRQQRPQQAHHQQQDREKITSTQHLDILRCRSMA